MFALCLNVLISFVCTKSVSIKEKNEYFDGKLTNDKHRGFTFTVVIFVIQEHFPLHFQVSCFSGKFCPYFLSVSPSLFPPPLLLFEVIITRNF